MRWFLFCLNHKIAAKIHPEQEARSHPVHDYSEQWICITNPAKRELRRHFVDDGWSGTRWDRPGFSELMALVKDSKVGTIIVKDMSRLGRDYLQVGMYTDIVFPDNGVRFIAIKDNVDSENRSQSHDFTAIVNLFNEFHVRDTAKKVRDAKALIGKSGKYLAPVPPYGYLKDPQDKEKWIVDEQAAKRGCSAASYIARIAARSSTLQRARAITVGKTITVALTTKALWGCVLRTLFARKF